MADDGAGAYNDTNRAFLQAFISHGALTFEEAKPILAAIESAYSMLFTMPLMPIAKPEL